MPPWTWATRTQARSKKFMKAPSRIRYGSSASWLLARQRPSELSDSSQRPEIKIQPYRLSVTNNSNYKWQPSINPTAFNPSDTAKMLVISIKTRLLPSVIRINSQCTFFLQKDHICTLGVALMCFRQCTRLLTIITLIIAIQTLSSIPIILPAPMSIRFCPPKRVKQAPFVRV